MDHLVDINSLALSVEHIRGLAGFRFFLGSSVDSQLVVVRLPVDTVEVLNISIDRYVLVSEGSHFLAVEKLY